MIWGHLSFKFYVLTIKDVLVSFYAGAIHKVFIDILKHWEQG